MVKCIVIVAVLVVFVIALAIYSRTVTDTTACRLPSRHLSQCVDLEQCQYFQELLEQKRKENFTHSLLADIQQFKCGSSSDQKVCCPIKFTPREKTSDEDNSDSLYLPPKTQNNFDKLPSDCGINDNINFDRVAYGGKADLFEFPWVALLGYKDGNEINFRCAGSLIHKRYVLTAAHCLLKRYSRYLVYVRLGEHNLNTTKDCHKPKYGSEYCSPPTQDIPVEDIFLNPNFDEANKTNDIALIKLRYDADISQDNVRPICLPSLPSIQHRSLSDVVISGFGLTENLTRSYVLLKSAVPVLDLQTCQNIYKYSIKIDEKQICAIGPKGEASCQGDSGGAVTSLQSYNIEGDLRYVQYGIVSVGPPMCGDNQRPSISTRVEFYLDWILDTIQ